ILLQQTYPANDPLNETSFSDDQDELDRAAIEKGTRRSQSPEDDEQTTLFVTLINPGDADPVQSGVIDEESAQRVKRQVSKLLTQVSPKERALIEQALNDDGDILALLQKEGTSPDAIRKKRERLRRKLSK